uniref:RNA dependent RNA polymerase n=1 Tax=Rhizopus microsporus narnavirus 1 TaxID=3156532 RepID=A0AAT9H807_9VIRU
MPTRVGQHREVISLVGITLSEAYLTSARLGGHVSFVPHARQLPYKGGRTNGFVRDPGFPVLLQTLLARGNHGRYKQRRDGFIPLIDAWAALIAAVAASGFTKLDISTAPGRDAAWGLCHLARWTVHTAIGSGVGRVISDLKSWSSDFRRWAVEGVPSQHRVNRLARSFRGPLRRLVDHDESAAQISYLGRALPRGSPAVCHSALKKHRDALFTEHRTPPDLLLEAELFARDWSLKYLKDEVPGWVIPVKDSSCLEYSRREGGFTRAVGEIRQSSESLLPSLKEEQARPTRLMASPTSSQAPVGATLLEREAFVRECLRRYNERGYHRAQAVALPERGWKARVVTKSSAALVCLGHQIRRWLFAGLRRDGRARHVLEGEHKLAVEGAMRDFGVTTTVVSSDLTSASDLLPFDLIQAIVKGLLRNRNVPEWFQPCLQSMTGPMVVGYPWGEQITTRRGILMGLPTTWALLSIVQLFWIDRAAVAASRCGFRGDLILRSAAVCGDDLVASWPQVAVDAYHQAARMSGAKFSEGKHFVSRRALVFTEELAWVGYRRKFVAHRDLGPSWVGQSWKHYNPLGACAKRGWVKKVWVGDHRSVPYNLAHLPRWYPTKHGFVTEMEAKIQGLVDDGPWMCVIYQVARQSVNRRCLATVRWSDAIPLRGLVRPSRLPGDTKLSPWWAALGPAASSISSGSQRRMHRVRRVIRVLHPNIFGWALRNGMVAEAPRAFGGLELPPRRGASGRVGRLDPVVRKGLAVQLYGRSLPDLRSPAALWAELAVPPLVMQAAREVVERCLTAWSWGAGPTLVRSGASPWQGEFLNLGGVMSGLTDLTVSVASDITTRSPWSRQSSVARTVCSPRSLGREVKAFYARLAAKWPGARGVDPAAPWDKLLKRWESLDHRRFWAVPRPNWATADLLRGWQVVQTADKAQANFAVRPGQVRKDRSRIRDPASSKR